MIRITAYVRPHRLEMVKTAVAATGVTGVSVADVRGTGVSPESARLFGHAAPPGSRGAMPVRSRLTAVAPDALAEAVVAAIVENARSGPGGEGMPDDGKIFLERVADAVRVRTGERGEPAV